MADNTPTTDGVEVEQEDNETTVKGPNAAQQDEAAADTEPDADTEQVVHTKDTGVTLKGKVEEDNDDGPRSKSSLTLKATGVDAEAAAEDFETAVDYVKENGVLKELHDMRKQVRTPEEADDE